MVLYLEKSYLVIQLDLLLLKHYNIARIKLISRVDTSEE